MNKIESIKLFKDLQLVSTKYSHLKLRDEPKEIEDNRKLNSLLQFHQSKSSEVIDKCNFVAMKAKEELQNATSDDINNTIIALNSFSRHKYDSLITTSIESTTTKVVMFSTLDELILINNSIATQEYLKDKDKYFAIYKDVVVNAFITFLALKEMDLDETIINNLSQGIFNQIKVISILDK